MRRQVVHGDAWNQRAVAQRIERWHKRRLRQSLALCTNRPPNLEKKPEAKHDHTQNGQPHGQAPWPLAARGVNARGRLRALVLDHIVR